MTPKKNECESVMATDLYQLCAPPLLSSATDPAVQVSSNNTGKERKPKNRPDRSLADHTLLLFSLLSDLLCNSYILDLALREFHNALENLLDGCDKNMSFLRVVG